MKEYTEITLYTVNGRCGMEDEFKVWLKIGPQSFCVTSEPHNNFYDAEWMRKRLETALSNIKCPSCAEVEKLRRIEEAARKTIDLLCPNDRLPLCSEWWDAVGELKTALAGKEGGWMKARGK